MIRVQQIHGEIHEKHQKNPKYGYMDNTSKSTKLEEILEGWGPLRISKSFGMNLMRFASDLHLDNSSKFHTCD